MGRVFRAAGESADNYDADAILIEIDFHFQSNKLGTDDEYPE